MFYKIEISLIYFLMFVGLTSVARGYLADVLVEADKLNATASELLLELMIKIAIRPYQWSRVHKLLANISSDTLTLKRKENNINSEQLDNVRSPKQSPHEEPSKHVGDWPTYHKLSQLSKTKNEMKHYLKTFVYQKVTGNSAYFAKNPKSYIAVSIVAPKNPKTTHLDDMLLEKELQQLRPWTHKENMRKMALFRSRWILRTDNGE